MATESRNVIRIPPLHLGKMVDANGMPTDDEKTFRQGLVSLLQQLFGNEGIVMPSQTATNILTIQNHTAQAQGATPNTSNTCAFGTMIYESDTALVKVSIEDPLGSGTPVFKTVTVT